MPQPKFYGTRARWHDKTSPAGVKPSEGRLVNMIDIESPAFPRIAALLHQMAQAGVELDENAIAIATKLGEHQEQTAVAATPAPRAITADTPPNSIVYYVRRGNLIKIGTTANPKTRFLSLCPDEILAFEPGGRTLEARRHQQFKHLRHSGSEYFRIGSDLQTHVQQVRREHGAPDPSWRALNTASDRSIAPAADRALPASAEMCNVTQAAQRLGIKRATAQKWVSRGKITAIARDRRGNPVYFLDQFRELMAKSPAYGSVACDAASQSSRPV